MPRTLLLADDSVTIQRVIELTFADQDIHVVAVGDGDQAIARLEAAPPDIVLADVGMPGRSGYDVARYVRNSPKLSHIPVVLLTGAFEPIDQERADAAGCDGVLAKPFEPQLVIGRVKELLARGAAAKQPPRAPAESKPPAPAAAPQPVPPPVAQPVETPSWSPFANTDRDKYFEELDEALTKATREPMELPPAKPPSVAPPKPELVRPARPELVVPPRRIAPETPDQSQVVEIDSYASEVDLAATRSIDLPLAPPPEPPVETTPPETVAAPPAAEMASSQAAETPPPAEAETPPVETETARPFFPSIADAFAALLAAEQNEPVPSVRPAWPASNRAATNAPGDLVDETTRRVMDRLSEIAEKLVREEIERVKGSIK